MLENKKGQNTLEYIILVSAVIGIALVFLGPEGIFRSRLNQSFDSMANSMTYAANQLKGVKVY